VGFEPHREGDIANSSYSMQLLSLFSRTAAKLAASPDGTSLDIRILKPNSPIVIAVLINYV
jgi:hypothetical protein